MLPLFASDIKSQDKIFASYNILAFGGSNAGTDIPKGFQQINLALSTHTANFAAATAAGWSLDYIALNKNQYLYSIQGASAGLYNIISYNTQNDYASVLAKENITWDGNTNTDARPEGLAVSADNKGWAVAYSVIDGNNYLTSFQTNENGGAGNFLSNPYILKTDILQAQVKDIAFDFFNNIYALVLDLNKGYQYIYFANNRTIANSNVNIPLTKLFQISDENNVPIKYNPQYTTTLPPDFAPFESYTAEGLAFSSDGSLIISVDKMDFKNVNSSIGTGVNNMLYLIKPGSNEEKRELTLFSSPRNIKMVSSCTDLASNYFPVFLPLRFADVRATISDNKLRVNWATETERNNVKFNIAISKDGSHFTNVGDINTVALNGNANDVNQYNFDCDFLKITFSFLHFLLIVGVAMPSCAKRKTLKRILFLILLFCACSKNNSDTGPNQYKGKVFVKVIATDESGVTTASAAVQAIRE